MYHISLVHVLSCTRNAKMTSLEVTRGFRERDATAGYSAYRVAMGRQQADSCPGRQHSYGRTSARTPLALQQYPAT